MHRESIVLIYRTSFSYVFFSHSVVQHITFCVLYVLEIKVLWKFLVAEMRNCTTELEREDKKNDNQGKIRKKYEYITRHEVSSAMTRSRPSIISDEVKHPVTYI